MNKVDLNVEDNNKLVMELNNLMYGVPARLQRAGWDKTTEAMLRDLESAKTCINDVITLVKEIEENNK